jgi:hypothetical protein
MDAIKAPAEEVAKMSARQLSLLRFFSAVTFTAAACVIIQKCDIGIDDVEAAWEVAHDAVHFLTVLRLSAPDFPGKEATKMAAVLQKLGRSAAATSSARDAFVERVAAAAARDPSRESIAKATDEAYGAVAADVGKSELLRDVIYHGAELLSQPAEDAKAARKLKQMSLAAGGTWRKHATTEKAWAAYTRRNVSYLLAKQRAPEAQRLQVFDIKRPPIGQGGREYLEEYFMKYGGFLEVEVDLELKADAVAAAAKVHEGHFGQIAELVAAVQQVQSVTARLDRLEEAGETSSAPLKCGKCWQFGHSTKECGLSAKEAAQSREAIKAGRVAAAKAKQEKEEEFAKADDN